MKAIIEYLDNYLTRIGRPSINPVEANAILAKAGILHDNKDRPGKPLRDLLRKGHFPHAFQSGGKGSFWAIPHSERKALEIFAVNPVEAGIEKFAKLVETTKISTTNTFQLKNALLNEENFMRADSIDNLVPHKSGLYCIRIIDNCKLPEPFSTYLTDRRHNIIYIGVATKSLKKRFLDQELRAIGHGTFFRSIGALLGHQPPKGSLEAKKNKRNYKFSCTDEEKIINWINTNLKVSWVEFQGDFEKLETELINKHRPLVNISKNPSALRELSDLRKLCIKIAKQQ